MTPIEKRYRELIVKDTDNMHPREYYLWGILKSFFEEGLPLLPKFDDLADMENILKALQDATDLINQTKNILYPQS